MEYTNKKTRQVGLVVHKGITTTLRFEDESELTLSPARLRDEWELVKEPAKEHDNKATIKRKVKQRKLL